MEDSKRNTEDFKTLQDSKYSISKYIEFIGWGFGFLTFVMLLGERFNLIMLGFFIISYVSVFLLSPVVAIFEKSNGEYIDFFDSFLIGIRGLLTILGIAAFYRIFISLDYDIYFSYWIFPLSFLFLISMETVETLLRKILNIEDKSDNLKHEDEFENEEKSLWQRTKNLLYIVVTAGLLYQQYYEPVLILNEGDIVAPTSIYVSLIKKDEISRGSIWNYKDSQSLIESDDSYLIENLWSDVTESGIKKLRYGELINYQKMQRTYDSYYSILLLYDENIRTNTGRENRAEYIDIYPNGNVYLLKYNSKNFKTEIFPTSLSEDTLKSLGIN